MNNALRMKIVECVKNRKNYLGSHDTFREDSSSSQHPLEKITSLAAFLYDINFLFVFERSKEGNAPHMPYFFHKLYLAAYLLEVSLLHLGLNICLENHRFTGSFAGDSPNDGVPSSIYFSRIIKVFQAVVFNFFTGFQLNRGRAAET